MSRAELKVKELGVTMNDVYEFIKDNAEAKKDFKKGRENKVII